jgi:hypothetical protein
MLTSQQSLETAFRADAIEHRDIPVLGQDSVQRCIELFFDSAEIPNFVILDGKFIRSSPPKIKTGCACIAGDNGPIFIRVRGETLLDKREGWQLPDIDYSGLEKRLEALTLLARSLYSSRR